MKKEYKIPHFQVILVDSSDLVCTSGPETMGPTTENEVGCARFRNNPIWDDYEN